MPAPLLKELLLALGALGVELVKFWLNRTKVREEQLKEAAHEIKDAREARDITRLFNARNKLRHKQSSDV